MALPSCTVPLPYLQFIYTHFVVHIQYYLENMNINIYTTLIFSPSARHPILAESFETGSTMPLRTGLTSRSSHLPSYYVSIVDFVYLHLGRINLYVSSKLTLFFASTPTPTIRPTSRAAWAWRSRLRQALTCVAGVVDSVPNYNHT